MKRWLIYFHFDPQGIVDEPCRIAVTAMRLYTERVFFVTNGTLRQESRLWADALGIRLVERENVGFDAGAYRQVILMLGREELAGIDELVLMNYTLAGPVRSPEPLFQKMEARGDVDFWGLTCHAPMVSRRFGGRVPMHLQSHFLVVRRTMLQSDAFWTYWEKMRLPRSYEQAVFRHECRFTAWFSARGFRWASAVEMDDLLRVFLNPVMACPRLLVEQRGCPFFKRRSFFTDLTDELRRTDGSAASDLYCYLKQNTDYPVELLVRSLLRTVPVSVLAHNLHWQYALPEYTASTQGLTVLRFPVPETDPATRWYLQQRADWAQDQLSYAAALFEKYPLLGVAGPALPLWNGALHSARLCWRKTLAEREPCLQNVSADPGILPPGPGCGWLVIRREAFPFGIPDQEWLAPLIAQQNGYTCCSFAPVQEQGALRDRLQILETAAQDPSAVARQFARLAKRRWGRG